MPTGRLAILGLLFFCSGACGLIYQVLWLRQLSIVLGVTVYAASTVLASFMTGLALGSVLASRVLRWLKRPLTAFGLAEILIGVAALATPAALSAAIAVSKRRIARPATRRPCSPSAASSPPSWSSWRPPC